MRGGIAHGTHPALTRDEAIALLARHGFSPIEPVLEFENVFGGLEVGGLRLGLGATPRFDAFVSQHRNRCAVPIGTSHTRAIYWMDEAGDCYDDTDYEWCVPIGTSARALLDYWLITLERDRWSGAVHDYIAQLEAISADELAAILGITAGGIAVGSTAVWSERATRATDTLPSTHSWSAGATFSAPDVISFVDVLRATASARRDLRIYLAQPSLPVLEDKNASSVMRFRCVHLSSPSREGVLCVSSDGPSYRLELVSSGA